MISLTNKDLLLISKLRENSRGKLTKISKETGVPISTIFDKIKEFKSGLIQQFSCLIDFEQCGYPIKSKLMVEVTPEDRKKLEKYLYYNENVNSLYKINNGFHFLIEGIFKNMQSSEQFIEDLEHKFKIKKIQNHYVLKDLKREKFDPTNRLTTTKTKTFLTPFSNLPIGDIKHENNSIRAAR